MRAELPQFATPTGKPAARGVLLTLCVVVICTAWSWPGSNRRPPACKSKATQQETLCCSVLTAPLAPCLVPENGLVHNTAQAKVTPGETFWPDDPCYRRTEQSSTRRGRRRRGRGRRIPPELRAPQATPQPAEFVATDLPAPDPLALAIGVPPRRALTLPPLVCLRCRTPFLLDRFATHTEDGRPACRCVFPIPSADGRNPVRAGDRSHYAEHIRDVVRRAYHDIDATRESA